MLTNDLRNKLTRSLSNRCGEYRFVPSMLDAIEPDYDAFSSLTPRPETEDEMLDRIDGDIKRERLARDRSLNRKSANFDLYFDVIAPRRRYRASLAS